MRQPVKLDLSALSAFMGFGMEKSHLVRPSLPPQDYEVPQPILVGSGTMDRPWLVLGDGILPASGGASQVSRVSRRGQTQRLMQLGSWCGSAQPTLEELWPTSSMLLLDAEFLADLADPRPLLLALKRRCLRTGEAFLVSAPKRGTRQWCWSASEFEKLLELCGFVLTSEKAPTDRAFWWAELTPASLARHLDACGFDPAIASASQLLVTSEDATIVPTGGIGTYTKVRKHLSPNLPVLYCDFEGPRRSADRRTFWPDDLVGPVDRESFVEGLGLVEAVRVLLVTLPQIQLIEFQDYQSLGFRLVQSKVTSGLPRDLTLRVLLHGGVDYVKHGIQDAEAARYSLKEASLAARDCYILANVDEALSPSRYLADLLQHEFGYTISRLGIAPLPFPLDALPPSAKLAYGPIRRIAFIGKYNVLKGWPDFLEAVQTLSQTGALGNIDEIVSISPGAPAAEASARLQRIAHYTPLHFNHEEFLHYLTEHRADTLFVIPSRGENYPFVVLEQVLIGTRFVAYASGGIPEVIGDPTYRDQFCSHPTPQALGRKIAEVIQLLPTEHGGLAHEMMERARSRQLGTNASWTSEAIAARPLAVVPLGTPDVSIVVPVYNTKLEYLVDLMASIGQSIVQPNELIFIDDGSDDDHAIDLAELVEQWSGRLPTRIVRQSNRGLAAARNRGLIESRSEFTYFLDSDDLLLPSTLQDAWIAMRNNSDLLVTTGFGLYFADKGRLPQTPTLQRDGTFWKPLGIVEARSVSLVENQYMAANLMARTEALRQWGGWDETDRSMWEDWAFFNTLAWSGKCFSILPAAGFLYRNTPGSMSKTYSQYFARRRLVRSLPMMTRLDAATVISLVGSGGDASRAILPLTSYEAELIGLSRKILSRPRLRRAAAWGYRTLSKVRRAMTRTLARTRR
jgi:glycosyltransferase involved in cell wall biosynthesis